MDRATAVRIVSLTAIERDRDLQARDGLDGSKVAEYAEVYRAGGVMPPVVLFEDHETWWLADGWHRVAAAELAELEEIEADVRPGTRRDALEWALAANATHGLPRTNADKRRAVFLALEGWPSDSDRAIARRCLVHHDLVGTIRRELAERTGEAPPAVRRGADGREIDTTRIAAANRERPAAMPAEEVGTSSVEHPAVPEVSDGLTSAPAGGSQRPPAGHLEEDPPRPDQLAEVRARLRDLSLSREELAEVLGDVNPTDVRAAVRRERLAGDAYYTPAHVAHACVRWLKAHGYTPRRPTSRILEAHVGRGAWLDALRRLQIPGHVQALDLDAETGASARDALGFPCGEIGDFLSHEFDQVFDFMPGNPPFADAEAHVRRALVGLDGAPAVLREGGILAWILRRDWIGAARARLVEEGLAPLEEVVLTPRVSFAFGGSDMHEHSMFVWRGGARRTHWRTTVLDVGRGPKGGEA